MEDKERSLCCIPRRRGGEVYAVTTAYSKRCGMKRLKEGLCHTHLGGYPVVYRKKAAKR